MTFTCTLAILKNWVFLLTSVLSRYFFLVELTKSTLEGETVCFYSGEIQQKVFPIFDSIFQFSCLFDKGTAKICKKFKSHNGFLRADQSRTKIAARFAGLAVLSCR